MPLTVQLFDPGGLLDDYAASRSLGQIEQQADGTWQATATSWKYDLDAAAAYALGFITDEQNVTVDTFRVVVDGSKQWVLSISLIAHGPIEASVFPPYVDLSPSGSDQITYRFGLRVAGTAQVCWPHGARADWIGPAGCPAPPGDDGSDRPSQGGEPPDPK